MDLQVLVLTADEQLGELIKAQVDNLGCTSSLVSSYESAVARLGWAQAIVIDLVGEGLEDLRGLRLEAPSLPVLAIVPDATTSEAARSAGAQQVLIEPFSIADIVNAVKAMGPPGLGRVVDLDAAGRSGPVADDKPWWATR